MRVIATYATGFVPHHVTASWDMTKLYVNNTSGNSLQVIDPHSGKVVDRLDIIDPYNLYRGIAGFVGEALLECWQALRQKIENVQPRTHRAGKFCFQRAGSVVIARDATTWGVVLGMYQAQPVIFCNYLGYDEDGLDELGLG